MQSKNFLVLFLYLNVLSIGIIPTGFHKNSILRENKNLTALEVPCEIDNYYDSLVRLKIGNILLYKELKTSAGNKGLVIWKDKNCIYGVKFIENYLENCKKEEINPDNHNLGLIALKFFYSGEKDYSVTKSNFESMHDFKIEIRAIVNGKEMSKVFFDSSVWNKSEFLPEISRLCKNIINNW